MIDPPQVLSEEPTAVTPHGGMRGRTSDDYAADSMLRSGVERQFEIIGEALRQLEKTALDVALRA